MIELMIIAAAWFGSVVLAYVIGHLVGNKKCNDWWNQYGAQIFAERGAVIYGTALYKTPPAPQNGLDK